MDRLRDRWLQGRTSMRRQEGLSHRDALIQALRDWAEQERLEAQRLRARGDR